MINKRETLNQIPQINETVTVTSRTGQSVTGPLIQAYRGVSQGHIRGAVRTGPDKRDFATGLIGILVEDF